MRTFVVLIALCGRLWPVLMYALMRCNGCKSKALSLYSVQRVNWNKGLSDGMCDGNVYCLIQTNFLQPVVPELLKICGCAINLVKFTTRSRIFGMEILMWITPLLTPGSFQTHVLDHTSQLLPQFYEVWCENIL